MISPQEKLVLLRQAEELCRENGATLLYLTLFGSTLYGTETPGKSDLDLRGVFLPSPESLALNRAAKSLHRTTGDAHSHNSAADVDMDLWSAQHWLLKLLPSGDTGALDVLFSPSHADCVLYRHPALERVFAAPLRLMDTAHGRAYAEYSLGQAKKYGIKGSRIGALKTVRNWLRENRPEPDPQDPQERLQDCLEPLLAACADGRFCTAANVLGEPAVQLCGKLHIGKIRLVEFTQRVEQDMRRYGSRAEEAERNRGLDFKALSHALRALDQMEELLLHGRVHFPLKNRAELLAVKQGEFPWEELEPRILARLEAVDALREKAPFVGSFDLEFAEACLLDCYAANSGSSSQAGQLRETGPKTERTAGPVFNRKFQPGFSIPDATLAAIEEKLALAEREHRVKVLYACESGSRGWGFASPDSDFDVRFIYAHEPDWYLGLAPEERRDVIELGIENTPVGELDVNGWELRKALKLFRQSNSALLEWLSSPLIYHEHGCLAGRLRAETDGLSPLRSWHHYRSLMEKSLERFREKKPSIKTWFYALRPLLAMLWLEKGLGRPPMRFDALVDGVITEQDLRRELDELVEIKKQAGEGAAFTPPRLAEGFMRRELERLRLEPPALPAEKGKAGLDEVFNAALFEAWERDRNAGALAILRPTLYKTPV